MTQVFGVYVQGDQQATMRRFGRFPSMLTFFHVECIEMWFHSHDTNVGLSAPPPMTPLPPSPAPTP
jgi:hypothetical protein